MSMRLSRTAGSLASRLLATSALALCVSGAAIAADPAPATSDSVKTETPIKHVIVVIGENRTFDHVFATYTPNPSQSILNLLSEGIIQADGSPGPNFAAAKQFTTGMQPSYYIGVTSSQKTLFGAARPDLGRRAGQPEHGIAAFQGPVANATGGHRALAGER